MVVVRDWLIAHAYTADVTNGDQDSARARLGPGQQVRLPKAAEIVANSLRRKIVTGALRTGDLLPREGDLMAEFDVSRPTLREALRVLESEGFIRMRRGANGGALVQLPSDDRASRYFGALLQSQQTSLADVYAARTIIEAPVAGLVAANWDKDDLQALQQSIANAEAVFDDPAKLWDACSDFHRVLIDVAGNSTIRLMSGLLDNVLDQATRPFAVGGLLADQPMTVVDQPTLRIAHEAHVTLVELIVAHDSHGAEKLWAAHLDEAASVVLNAPGAKSVLDLLSVPA